ncbi:MAG: YaaA family protein [Acidimicrobiales bacterium]
MAGRTLILLPPSEGKALGGDGPPWREGMMRLTDLDSKRRVLLDSTTTAAVDPAGPTLAAIERYTGVLYRELDASTLRGQSRHRLDRDVLVVSGLWGLVAPTDPIPLYRLKMSARVDGIGKVAPWWRPDLSAALAERARGASVWDLLPIEHSAAVDWMTPRPTRRTTVRFVDRRGRVVSHWNKLLKGSLVRWLVKTGARQPEDLVSFDHPAGYRFDSEASVLTPRRAEVVMHEAP